jgi:hypothetical protein
MTTDARYSDFVTPPERRQAAGRDWYLRALHDSSGAVLTVNLYDSNGDYVGEFDSMAACETWLELTAWADV